MIWGLAFLFIIIAFAGYLLFAPFYVEINSINNLFGIRFHHLASAKLIFKDNSFIVDFRIAGWNKQIDPLTALFKRKTKIQKKKKAPKKIQFRLLKTILKSFKINKCYLNIDTGNWQLNGMLYPGFYYLSNYTGKSVGINFSDKNEIILQIENNLARVIRAFIYTSLKTRSWKI